MKPSRSVSLSWLIGVALMLQAWLCAAQPLTYEVCEADAIARAHAEGKMILTDFGRAGCSECVAMQLYFEKTNPPLRQWLQASCVLWSADVDESDEWRPYASGLGTFLLPLMCFVDPARPGTYTTRKTGLISANTFLYYVQSQALKNLPLVVTNLPGGPLEGPDFVVKGFAQTNAAFRGSVTNVPIVRILWRLNGIGHFQPATGTTEWSQAVSLSLPNNTFESYVEYQDSRHSWTNRVSLVTTSPRPRAPQVISFESLPALTYGCPPFVLPASASSGLPVLLASDNPNVVVIAGTTATIVGVGRAVITASQEGNDHFLPADSSAQPLVVGLPAPGDMDGNGVVTRDELNAVLANYWATSPSDVASIAIIPQTSFTFSVGSTPGTSYRVQFATESDIVCSPDNQTIVNWRDLGLRFIDPNASAEKQRIYRLVAP